MMNLTEKYQKITEPGQPLTGLFAVHDVTTINHKPHPFTIGPRHIAYASEHCGGILREDVMEKIPCAARGCGLGLAQHTSDRVLALKLLRTLSHVEAQAALAAIVPTMTEDKIDGIIFIDTPERFRILPPETPDPENKHG